MTFKKYKNTIGWREAEKKKNRIRIFHKAKILQANWIFEYCYILKWFQLTQIVSNSKGQTMLI